MTVTDQIKTLDKKIRNQLLLNKQNLIILYWVNFFNRGFKEEDKKERLLKRLKNIGDKSEEKLKAIKNKIEGIKEVTDFVEEPLSLEAKGLIEEIRIIQKDVVYRKLKIIGGNKNTCDFSDYKTFKELLSDLYYRNMTIGEVGKK